jgi:hypothetical protein
MRSAPILIVEPQCKGVAHLAFNSALLQSLSLAFPDAPLIFAAEAGHLGHVRSETPSLDWQPVPISVSGNQNFSRFSSDSKLLREAFSLAASHGARRIVFASVTPHLILLLKTRFRAELGRLDGVLAIPHAILSSLTRRISLRRPWLWFCSMQAALACPSHPRLRFAALGGSILDNLRLLLHQQLDDWFVLEHPYQFAPIEPKPYPPSAPVIGLFGSQPPGLAAFADLASRIRPHFPETEFLLVGYDYSGLSVPAAVSGWGTQPLEPDEFTRRALRLDWAVWLSNPQDYRLTASGAFLDCLAYRKPLFYLDNPFIAHYTEALPVGISAPSVAALAERISAWLAAPDPARHARFQDNLFALRERFHPASVAAQIRTGWGEGNC